MTSYAILNQVGNSRCLDHNVLKISEIKIFYIFYFIFKIIM